jgi:ATP synthase protein I
MTVVPEEQDPLIKGVRLRDERVRRGEREGEPSVARRLGQIGVLGWIVVTPMLIGVFAGRWLDRTFNSGLFCTAPLLMIGAVLDFVCVWWNARLFAERGGAWLSILLLLGRIAVLGCLLTLAAGHGAMPLLAMALGVFVARFAVMCGLRTAAP